MSQNNPLSCFIALLSLILPPDVFPGSGAAVAAVSEA